jgi:hypothetical protein
MTLYQFNSLDEMEQAEAVWDGVHIGERWDEEHNILPYQIDSFYIEVFHHKELYVASQRNNYPYRKNSLLLAKGDDYEAEPGKISGRKFERRNFEI